MHPDADVSTKKSASLLRGLRYIIRRNGRIWDMLPPNPPPPPPHTHTPPPPPPPPPPPTYTLLQSSVGWGLALDHMKGAIRTKWNIVE